MREIGNVFPDNGLRENVSRLVRSAFFVPRESDPLVLAFRDVAGR